MEPSKSVNTNQMGLREDDSMADLGRILFDSHSLVSLHLCLKPVDDSEDTFGALDPFEVISFGVG